MRIWVLIAIVLGLSQTAARAAETDCSVWALDGYRVGMAVDDAVAVRASTPVIDGQFQVVARGAFSGVLVLDTERRLEKWDVHYAAASGDDLLAELRVRLGDPFSIEAYDTSGDGPDRIHHRQATWRSAACDTTVAVIERTGLTQGVAVHLLDGILIRGSKDPVPAGAQGDRRWRIPPG